MAGAQAFKRDIPDAKIAILDAGHFAMDTRLDQVASLTANYMMENRTSFGAAIPDASSLDARASSREQA